MTQTTKKRQRGRRGDGTVEIVRGPDGTIYGYRAVLSLGRGPDGKRRVAKSPTFRTNREALTWKAAQLSGGVGTPAGRKTTLAEWATEWLALRKPDIAPRTHQYYDEHIRVHITPRIGHVALAQLSRLHVEKFLADLASDGVSNNVRFKVGKTLRTILKHAVNSDRIVKSPAAGV